MALTINPNQGRKVRKLRIKLGLTQVELSKQSGIARPNISTIERGKRVVGMDVAEALAKVLKVHPSEILYPDL